LTLTLQCFAKEAFSCTTVPAFRDQNIDHIPILIDCSPQVESLPSQGDEEFINMPDITQWALVLAELSSVLESELPAPKSNRLIRDSDTAFCKEILDITKTQRIPMVKPDCMTDDFWRKAMTFVAGIHARIVEDSADCALT